ncbi:MAG TPA: ATP-binding cassette domain-containing protein [Chthonomonadaceae bacterium]|nr:ATP-binding cassette domain-containing protein [Chthonomonadaceae bacterium]
MDGRVLNATASSDTVVEITNVSKTFRQRQRSERLGDVLRNLLRPTFREVHALSAINLCIARGEIVAYAGPNGAGKSTTVKLCSGMLAPDTGTVRVLGMDPLRERVRYVNHIGGVFGQRTELWNDHPVAASFEWKRVVWDIPQERYTRMVGQVRELLGLDAFFHSFARELSLGQRMRADLGLALLHEPDILFLDEPTLGLDVLAKRNMLAFLKDLNRERKITIMVTSHDMAELEQLAGRIVMVDKGRIAYDGDFNRLRREFADRRHLALETTSEVAPVLEGTEWVRSEAGRHEYTFHAAQTPIALLLEQASVQTEVLDVETHRAPIDDVIADIYEKWQGASRPAESAIAPATEEEMRKISL